MIAVEIYRAIYVPGYDSRWDVPILKISGMERIQESRKRCETRRKKERYFL